MRYFLVHKRAATSGNLSCIYVQYEKMERKFDVSGKPRHAVATL
ncbi:hypothetical protein SAMN05216386_0238 [Nitrosospira briensis]|uniref:Uncharacterized protein n=1 Tax=Nitrosospira briensis TaxID=35799 RepID=A0A1I4XQJ6_9PROT|nr:hypothetical protein SAMN05216386_0238 [Nitrosospira briensis]SFO01657.1 hypothetical protein SAMN05216332_103212 [Nitrosospira briensis]